MSIDWEIPGKTKPMSYGNVPLLEKLETHTMIDENGNRIPTDRWLPAKKEPAIAELKAALTQYNAAIDEMVITASQVEVKDDETNKLATMLGSQAKRLNGAIEKIRKDAVAEPNEFIKSVNGLAKSYQARLDEIERGLKAKISTYQARVELERRKAEEAARQAIRELQAKADAEAKAANVEPVKFDMPVLPAKPTVTRTEDGSSYQRIVWTYRVINLSLVPQELVTITPNDRAIKERIRGGDREIPGLEIYPETLTSFRKV